MVIYVETLNALRMKRNIHINDTIHERYMFVTQKPCGRTRVHLCVCLAMLLKHTTTLYSLSNHYFPSREWRVIVDLVQTNYHGGPMVLKSVRCDRAIDYEGSSLWSDLF